MSITAKSQTLVRITSPDFAQGYEKGRIWYFYGEVESLPVDDAYLMTNLIALHEDGAFRPEQLDILQWHIGFLMGMVSGQFIPE